MRFISLLSPLSLPPSGTHTGTNFDIIREVLARHDNDTTPVKGGAAKTPPPGGRAYSSRWKQGSEKTAEEAAASGVQRLEKALSGVLKAQVGCDAIAMQCGQFEVGRG